MIKRYIRPGFLIEVGCTVRRKRGARGRPSYRWVQGWQVFDPNTGRWSVEVRWRDALAMARNIKEVPT